MPDPISWEYAWPYFLAALLFGYLLGSIPFGLLLGKLFGHGDIRDIGSGNIGATNALRTGNKLLAVGTLLGDLLKGTIAVVVASNYGPDTAHIAGLGAFLGHLFPVWLKFKGGKGVATYIGILLGLFPLMAVIFCATWLLTAILSKTSSLAALVASIITPIGLYWFLQFQSMELMALLTILIFWSHRSNIQRLIAGEEPKIGTK